MTMHTINEHKVDVPDDMRVIHELGIPGGYDHIKYRGIEICTYEQNDDQEFYQGTFVAWIEGDPVDVKDLAEARTLIDDYTVNMAA
ncbi:hypothetical protein EV128_12580 [Rhizobium azibense]|nr:hypothetical protein EV128_12580 [Rhizobium azibense]